MRGAALSFISLQGHASVAINRITKFVHPRDGITIMLKTQYLKRTILPAVIAITLAPFLCVQAETDQADPLISTLAQTVANEMAHALVAHECGKLRQPKMTAGYESGVYMSMNKLSLPKSQVTQILIQEATIALTDTVSDQLFQEMDQGLISCDDIYKYVVQGLMPNLDIIGKQ